MGEIVAGRSRNAMPHRAAAAAWRIMTSDHDSLPRANTFSVTETSWGSATTAGTLAWAIDQANMPSATGNLISITGLNADGLDRFAFVEAGARLDVTTAGIVNSVNFDFSGRNITPGFEALAGATLNLSSSTPLRQLVQMLFESAGSETSIRRLAAALGISVDTISLSIDAAESAYLAIGCPFFSWSERQRIVRNRKYYPIDTGLRRGAVTTTGHDRGKQLECAVFLLLRRRFQQVHDWRGNGEIDFVVDHRGKPTPVQVSWDATNERARRAVDEFHAAHPTAAEAVFVTAESFEAGVPERAPADDDGA